MKVNTYLEHDRINYYFFKSNSYYYYYVYNYIE